MPARQARYPGRFVVMPRSEARQWLYRAVTSGGDVAPWCQNKVELPAIGLPGFLDFPDLKPTTLTIRVGCRKCEGCLTHRSRLWTARAVDEIIMARRSWFVTLTVDPFHRFRLGLLAEKRWLRASGEVISDLEQPDRFRYLVNVLAEEVTKFIKRVRKSTGRPIRYLCVFEAHKDGFPHSHLLLHERGEPITKRSIEGQWPFGFTQVKLVDDGPAAAFYVAKYLAKEASARVRASQRYGQGLQAFLTEQILGICDAASPRGEDGGGTSLGGD